MALTLELLDEELAVCRLPADAEVPAWAWNGALVSVTRTREELSVVCAAAAVPQNVQSEGPWRALTVNRPLPFEMTGVAAALTQPLAAAGISLFLLATYDTDHLLVKAETLDAAIQALEAAGHRLLD